MKDEILKTELIGKHTTVVQSSNKTLEGIKGVIVDETRNTITLETENGEKKIIKEQAILEIDYKNNTYHINGKLLVNRPEERTKKVRTLK